MDYEADRIKVNPIQQPSLAEMTEKAIRLLSRSPNGYFLFVEGSLLLCFQFGLFYIFSVVSKDSWYASGGVKQFLLKSRDGNETEIQVQLRPNCDCVRQFQV